MKQLAEKLISYLEKRKAIRAKDRDIYIYGAENALYTFVSTFGLLLVGLLLQRVLETSIIILLFYTNQSVGGGYHAKTHTGCFITMMVGLLVYLTALRFPYCEPLCVFIFCCAFTVLICFPLVLHPNKKYLATKSVVFSKRSRLVVLFQAVIFVVFACFDFAFWIRCLSYSIGLCAISRVVAVMIDKFGKQDC